MRAKLGNDIGRRTYTLILSIRPKWLCQPWLTFGGRQGSNGENCEALEYVLTAFEVSDTMPTKRGSGIDGRGITLPYCVMKALGQDVYLISDARNLFKRNQMPKMMFAKSLEMHCWRPYAT